MRARIVLFVLLAVVAAAAAVLSFAALEALGRACGFGELSFLLPVVLDAGACAGTVSWLSSPPGVARLFGRRLALVLLASSVAGNGIGHFLAAYRLPVPWLLLVAVSALAPMVLASVVHLAVVSAQDEPGPSETAVEATTEEPRYQENPGSGALGQPEDSSGDPVTTLIAEGVGRRRLAKELGVSEHQARQLLAARTNGRRAEVGDDD